MKGGHVAVVNKVSKYPSIEQLGKMTRKGLDDRTMVRGLLGLSQWAEGSIMLCSGPLVGPRRALRLCWWGGRRVMHLWFGFRRCCSIDQTSASQLVDLTLLST